MAHRRIHSEAILLRSVDFGESDRIVHLLCPKAGRLTAIAKGARRSVKRFAGTLDLCNLLRIQVEQRRSQSMPRLEQAVLIHPYLGLREQPARFALACYLIEIVDRMAPEGGHVADLERIYAFTRSALRVVECEQPDARLRLLLELHALAALGLRPELRICVACGRQPAAGDAVGFRIADGGLLCGACSLRADGATSVNLGTLRSLDRALELPLGELGRLGLGGATLAEAQRLVSRFQRFHTGLELRSERVLDGLLDDAARARASA
jgi:DNA repair protein RecO (recombination protein O)